MLFRHATPGTGHECLKYSVMLQVYCKGLQPRSVLQRTCLATGHQLTYMTPGHQPKSMLQRSPVSFGHWYRCMCHHMHGHQSKSELQRILVMWALAHAGMDICSEVCCKGLLYHLSTCPDVITCRCSRAGWLRNELQSTPIAKGFLTLRHQPRGVLQ